MCMIELALSPATKKILNKKKKQLSDKLDFIKKKRSVSSRCWYHTTNDFSTYFTKNRGNYKDSYKIEDIIKITLDVYVNKNTKYFYKRFFLSFNYISNRMDQPYSFKQCNFSSSSKNIFFELTVNKKMVSFWIKGISQEDNWQNVCIVYMSECFIKRNNYMVTCHY